MPNLTPESNIDLAIVHLKSLPITQFSSFEEIDIKFKLGLNTSYRKLKSYFRIAKKEIFIENSIKYYTMKGISELLDIGYSRIRHLFPSLRLPYVKIYYLSEKKLSIKKYYYLLAILPYLPKRYQERYNLAHIKNKNKSEFVLDNNPTDLSDNEYLIFRSLIEFYKNNYYWPSVKQLKKYISLNYDNEFDYSTIYRIIDRLVRKKYISSIFVNKFYTAYLIHKGPMLLTHKNATCFDAVFGRQLDNIRSPLDNYIEK